MREPRWTAQDRAEALALTEYRAGLCPNGCGQPLAESTAHYTAGPQYDARSTTCRACAAREETKRAMSDKNPDVAAKILYVVRTPRG